MHIAILASNLAEPSNTNDLPTAPETELEESLPPAPPLEINSLEESINIHYSPPHYEELREVLPPAPPPPSKTNWFYYRESFKEATKTHVFLQYSFYWLFLLVSAAQIIIGSLHLNECEQEPNLPLCLIACGVVLAFEVTVFGIIFYNSEGVSYIWLALEYLTVGFLIGCIIAGFVWTLLVGHSVHDCSLTVYLLALVTFTPFVAGMASIASLMLLLMSFFCAKNAWSLLTRCR